MSGALEVHRSTDRPVTVAAGRVTAHSFSFGDHYDPANVGVGPLIAHNDELVQPGHGYADHRHRDTEIVTWVLTGAVTHREPGGTAVTVPAGHVQVQSAGSGVVHSETVAPDGEPTRFVQCWLTPATWDGPPSYAVRRPTFRDGWATLACGRHVHADVLRIDVRATAYAGRLEPGHDLLLPDAVRRHVFVTEGEVELSLGAETVTLTDGDAARLIGAVGSVGSVGGVGGVGAVGGRLRGSGSVLVWALD